MCPQFGFLKLIRFFVFYKSFFFVIVIIAIFISRKNIVILCERCLQDMEWKNDTPAPCKKKNNPVQWQKTYFLNHWAVFHFLLRRVFVSSCVTPRPNLPLPYHPYREGCRRILTPSLSRSCNRFQKIINAQKKQQENSATWYTYAWRTKSDDHAIFIDRACRCF